MDGARAANLRPTWSKAWSRLGAALMGLQDYAEAKEAYARARDLEPDDKTISNAWLKVCSRLCHVLLRICGTPPPRVPSVRRVQYCSVAGTAQCMQADHEERQASQSGRLAFNKRKIKGAPAAATTAPAATGGSRARRPGVAIDAVDAGTPSQDGRRGDGAVGGARRTEAPRASRAAAAGTRAGGTRAASAHPPPKKAKRAVLSFGDDSEED